MVNVLDVAQHIYDEVGWVNSWKLQKLSYYIQAWGLAWDGDPVFDSRMEAWGDGPVSRDLHRENKYGRDDVYSTKLPGADSSKLTERQRAIADAVIAFYGKLTKHELIDLTHAEAPWLEARGDASPGAYCSTEIRHETMQATYSMMAILGESAPIAPPAVAEPMELVQLDQIFESEIDRWSDVLAELQQR